MSCKERGTAEILYLSATAPIDPAAWGESISIGFNRFLSSNQPELESLRKREGEMISLVIGLFIGAFIGFFLAAIIARGKSAESITPQPQIPLTKVTHP
jgi:hypothetical protein